MKDKQCLRTVEKFRSVVKDMLREAAPDATASQSQVMDETTAAAPDTTRGPEAPPSVNGEMETEGNVQRHNL